MYASKVQTFQGLPEELVSVLPESKRVTGKGAKLVSAANKSKGYHSLTCHYPSPQLSTEQTGATSKL